MHHSFLIYSSADGHLGCFHVLAIINSAAMNIGVHVSLSDLVSSVCMPRSPTDVLCAISNVDWGHLSPALLSLLHFHIHPFPLPQNLDLHSSYQFSNCLRWILQKIGRC